MNDMPALKIMKRLKRGIDKTNKEYERMFTAGKTPSDSSLLNFEKPKFATKILHKIHTNIYSKFGLLALFKCIFMYKKLILEKSLHRAK